MTDQPTDRLTPWFGGYALALGLSHPAGAFQTSVLALGLLITIYLLLGPLFARRSGASR